MMTQGPDDKLTSMTCGDIKALLSAIVDDELDGATRHEAERHLADCRDCRELISRVETIDSLVAADAEAMAAMTTISPGFEAAVLNRTVFANRRSLARRRWITWSGWLAAAAGFSLAATVWVVDRQQPERGTMAGGGVVPIGARDAASPGAWLKQSTVYEGSLPPESFSTSSTLHTTALRRDEAPPTTPSTIESDAPVTAAAPAVARRSDSAVDDVDAVGTAALLVRMLADADDRTFADVEQVRRIAEFDEVLERLAAVKSSLADRDRPAVMAAEGLLLRAVRGPLSVDDLRELRSDVTRLKLDEQLQSIARRLELARSL